MSEQRKQILSMLGAGKISVDEAERLLAALESNAAPQEPEKGGGSMPGSKPTFLHVKVQSEPGNDGHQHHHDNVDIKIPIMLLKAGMKLGSLMPDSARDKISSKLSDHGISIDLNKLDAEKLDVIIQALTETSIDIDSDREKVRIYCS
jgi:hypothetical protein